MNLEEFASKFFNAVLSGKSAYSLIHNILHIYNSGADNKDFRHLAVKIARLAEVNTDYKKVAELNNATEDFVNGQISYQSLMAKRRKCRNISNCSYAADFARDAARVASYPAKIPYSRRYKPHWEMVSDSIVYVQKSFSWTDGFKDEDMLELQNRIGQIFIEWLSDLCKKDGIILE